MGKCIQWRNISECPAYIWHHNQYQLYLYNSTCTHTHRHVCKCVDIRARIMHKWSERRHRYNRESHTSQPKVLSTIIDALTQIKQKKLHFFSWCFICASVHLCAMCLCACIQVLMYAFWSLWLSMLCLYGVRVCAFMHIFIQFIVLYLCIYDYYIPKSTPFPQEGKIPWDHFFTSYVCVQCCICARHACVWVHFPSLSLIVKRWRTQWRGWSDTFPFFISLPSYCYTLLFFTTLFCLTHKNRIDRLNLHAVWVGVYVCVCQYITLCISVLYILKKNDVELMSVW